MLGAQINQYRVWLQYRLPSHPGWLTRAAMPADATKWLGKACFNKPSAIGERQILPAHTVKIFWYCMSLVILGGKLNRSIKIKMRCVQLLLN